MEFKLLKKRVHNISGGNIGDFDAAPKRLEEVFGIPDYSEDDLNLSAGTLKAARGGQIKSGQSARS